MNGSSATIRSLDDAFARSDVPAALGALAPDAERTEAEGFPCGGTYSGPQAVLENVFLELGAEREGFAAVPREFARESATVVAPGEYSGKYKATGQSMKVPFVHVWKPRNGKLRTFPQHTDTAIVPRVLR